MNVAAGNIALHPPIKPRPRQLVGVIFFPALVFHAIEAGEIPARRFGGIVGNVIKQHLLGAVELAHQIFHGHAIDLAVIRDLGEVIIVAGQIVQPRPHLRIIAAWQAILVKQTHGERHGPAAAIAAPPTFIIHQSVDIIRKPRLICAYSTAFQHREGKAGVICHAIQKLTAPRQPGGFLGVKNAVLRERDPRADKIPKCGYAHSSQKISATPREKSVRVVSCFHGQYFSIRQSR